MRLIARKRLALTGAVALALVIVLAWQIVARRSPPPAAPRSQVTEAVGRVVTPDGKPVAGATVTLIEHQESEGVERASTTTDAAGAFRFPRAEWPHREPPPLVIAQARGWAISYHTVPYPRRPITVTLPPPTTLQVAFEDVAGRPLRSLGVAIQRLLIHGTGNQVLLPPAWQAKWARKTDARGVATFADLPQGGQVRVVTDDDRFAQLGSESFIDLAKAAVTTAAPITVPAAATISGQVLFGRNHKPAAGIRVTASDTDLLGYCWGHALTDAQGRYRITRLRPATYAVTLDLRGALAEDWTAVAHPAVALDEGQRVQGIDFTLVHGALITGRALARGTGRGLPGVLIAAYGTARPEGADPLLTETDAEGRYRLRVPAGEQRVMLWTNPPAGYIDPEKREVKLRLRDGQTRRVDFRFGGPLGPIHGKVVDAKGRPVPGAEVAVAPLAGKPTMGERIVRADARGEFDLPAGAVLLRARSGRAAALRLTTVTEGGNVTLELKDDALCAVSGVVMDPAGHPVGGALVELTLRVSDAKGNPTGREWRAATITTGSDGQYLFPSLWPDQWYVVSASPDPNIQTFGGDSALVKLKPGERQAQVDLRR